MKSWVEEQLEVEDKDPAAAPQYVVGTAYKALLELISPMQRVIRISPHSKPWWDDEVREARKTMMHTVQGCKAGAGQPNAWRPWSKARYALQKLIRSKKGDYWREFVENQEETDPWKVIQVAKDPFKFKSTLHSIQDGSTTLWNDTDISAAFSRHNFINAGNNNSAPTDNHTAALAEYTTSDLARTVTHMEHLLSKCSNSSAPGPDGIGYSVIKDIKGTTLGNALLRDVAHHVLRGSLPEEWKLMKVVMIPKPGKDSTQVKNWRPIVLAQTIGKLWDKAMADGLQTDAELHWGQMGGRRGHSAIDALMWITGRAEQAVRSKGRAHLLCFDVKSAFNIVRKDAVIRQLQGTPAEQWIPHVERFLTSRDFQMWWDNRARGQGSMTHGAPQGSPLSPILFLIFLKPLLEAIENFATQVTQTTHKRAQVYVTSYVDDINILIVAPDGRTRIMSLASKITVQFQTLAETMGIPLLDDKEDSLTFIDRKRPTSSVKVLGVIIDNTFSFKEHLAMQAAKGAQLWKALKQLGNINHGLPPTAWRQLYTGMIRPVMTWCLEVAWNNMINFIEAMLLVERNALRKCTGAYNGARNSKVQGVSAVELLHMIADAMQARWVARTIHNNLPTAALIPSNIGTVSSQVEQHTESANLHPRQLLLQRVGQKVTQLSKKKFTISWGESRKRPQLHLAKAFQQRPVNPEDAELVGQFAKQKSKDGWEMWFTNGSGLGGEEDSL